MITRQTTTVAIWIFWDRFLLVDDVIDSRRGVIDSRREGGEKERAFPFVEGCWISEEEAGGDEESSFHIVWNMIPLNWFNKLIRAVQSIRLFVHTLYRIYILLVDAAYRSHGWETIKQKDIIVSSTFFCLSNKFVLEISHSCWLVLEVMSYHFLRSCRLSLSCL